MMKKYTATERIDVVLEYMERMHPGPHTLQDIADMCGCNKKNIHQRVNVAIASVRRILKEGNIE